VASQANDSIEAATKNMLALSLASAKNFPLYPYSVTDTHTRVLEILPDIDATALIRCTLDQHELSENLQYEALSYVWGDLSLPRVSITCNKQTIDITPNLHYALFRLRQPHTSRVVWIDALCINPSK
jgi:hypothetical protein